MKEQTVSATALILLALLTAFSQQQPPPETPVEVTELNVTETY